LSLVRNQGKGWREHIDLEHNVCYNPDNHWNALTDGRQIRSISSMRATALSNSSI